MNINSVTASLTKIHSIVSSFHEYYIILLSSYECTVNEFHSYTVLFLRFCHHRSNWEGVCRSVAQDCKCSQCYRLRAQIYYSYSRSPASVCHVLLFQGIDMLCEDWDFFMVSSKKLLILIIDHALRIPGSSFSMIILFTLSEIYPLWITFKSLAEQTSEVLLSVSLDGWRKKYGKKLYPLNPETIFNLLISQLGLSQDPSSILYFSPPSFPCSHARSCAGVCCPAFLGKCSIYHMMIRTL